jgi:hypothetical protein
VTQYLISFGAHAMDHIPDQDAPAVARAAHAAVQEAINAGVYVSAGGLEDQPASIVATDGAVTDGTYPEAIGGFTLVDVPSREEALSGLPRSPSPAAARKRSGRSGPTPNSTRCSARLIAGGEVPAASDRRRPAALEQDMPWRSGNAGLRIDLSRGRGAAPVGPDVKPGPRADRIAATTDRPVERQPGRRGECARSSADPKRWQGRWAAGVTGRRTSSSARREPAFWATRLPRIAAAMCAFAFLG